MKNFLKNSGKKILLGNEGIVRGAIESGVQFVSTYPGTPASEIGNTFSLISKDLGIYFEFSVNEKIALEAGIGASFSGLKTLVAMKNFGLNVASDALMPFLYTGSVGPFVLVVADDPSCHSSAQSEQNSRGFSFMGHIPTLEPSDVKECRDFVKLAFQISSQFKIPVMIRLTTRVAHQKMPVDLKRVKRVSSKGKFVSDKKRFVTMPPRVLEMKKELLEKIEKVKEFAERSSINVIEKGKGKIGVVCSGVSYLYVKEALNGLDIPLLKLGFFYPLPEKKIKRFLKPLKKVLVVEELEGFLEKELKGHDVEVIGKQVLPEVGELTPELVKSALFRVLGKRYALKEFNLKKVKHLPRFCTGWPSCPYWKLFAAVKQAAPKNTIFGGDIGCYMIAALPPHSLYDYLSCMGSSIGIGHGIKKATNQKVIAFIGDGTFFHSGIPSLLNASYNNSNLLLIILDNRITAMTGQQPNPGMGKKGGEEDAVEIKIEDIVKALKVKNIKVIDQEEEYDELVRTIKRFLKKKELCVIVARRMCGLLAKRKMRK